MVHIINGEIVPDDDPRVRARQQPQQNQQPQRRFGSVHGGGSAAAPPTAGAAPPAAGASPLQGLARQVGLEGTVTIPAVLSLPARPVQKIHLAVAALLTAFFGWRALVFIAFAYFLSTQQPPATRHT
ncbi:hypothetical protein PI124_g4795 [Phytophthora idaei]|uniref:Transmembrane protein n=1 Tax=Phytophthora aleatoria TaxID=2496075 RepID=A0A8J5IZJ7_9STRA|nr:hypothetical protein PI125_g2305 [Phytophthora idaei]KAG3165728.1 hypothetical protein PI126_g4489 [Phytophthora idaei]KAG3250578.1 hypothetical protein PI124_g4795 [Phytophthora idaei]KAG6967120.1 hypothetical protein JG688_00006467 [Phytophthora aleatoria]